jgi:uncharacterized protein YbjT (DUF2867 family)
LLGVSRLLVSRPQEEIMSRTILVTGATGTVSRALIDALKASRAAVSLRALVRNEARAGELRGGGVETVVGDLDESESLPRAFEGVDELWLLTAPGPRAPENSMNALWAARQGGVKRVVRMSAIGAAHDAPTRNGRLHALSDQEVQASGLRWTLLRPHFFMQNLLGFAAGIERDGNLYFNLGQGRVGMVDVRDIAEVAARVLLDDTGRHDGKIYTPTGPESLSLADVTAELGRATNRAVRYVAVPDEAMRSSLLGFGVPPWIAGMTVEYGRAYAAGWGDFTTSHVADVLGRAPRSFESFVREQWPRRAA